MKRITIPNRMFFRMGDVAKILDLKPYVIRFWEGSFPFLAPDKGATGQRVYQRPQIESLILVKHLLYVERYSIEGAKKRISELRKLGLYRETLDQLIESGDTDKPSLQVGSRIEKSSIASLQRKLKELQTLIRDPGVSGHVVPGLKPIQ